VDLWSYQHRLSAFCFSFVYSTYSSSELVRTSMAHAGIELETRRGRFYTCIDGLSDWRLLEIRIDGKQSRAWCQGIRSIPVLLLFVCRLRCSLRGSKYRTTDLYVCCYGVQCRCASSVMMALVPISHPAFQNRFPLPVPTPPTPQLVCMSAVHDCASIAHPHVCRNPPALRLNPLTSGKAALNTSFSPS